MKHGAIAFLDTLGFKGIWRHHQAGAVLSKLKALVARAEEVQTPVGQESLHRESWVRFFSDTVILGCHMESQASRPTNLAEAEALRLAENFIALAWVTTSAAAAIAAAIDHPDPPLVYRGAISVGEFEMEDRFIVGPAIDEAAEAEKLAQGAFIWCCPSAMACMSETVRRDPSFLTMLHGLSLVQDYSVPLKGGDRITAHVVNPFGFVSDTNRQDFVRRVLDSFNSLSIDVSVKRQNTAAFLGVAEAQAADLLADLVAALVNNKAQS